MPVSSSVSKPSRLSCTKSPNPSCTVLISELGFVASTSPSKTRAVTSVLLNSEARLAALHPSPPVSFMPPRITAGCPSSTNLASSPASALAASISPTRRTPPSLVAWWRHRDLSRLTSGRSSATTRAKFAGLLSGAKRWLHQEEKPAAWVVL